MTTPERWAKQNTIPRQERGEIAPSTSDPWIFGEGF